MRLHLAAHPAKVQNRVDPAQEMIGWNHILEIELIEKPLLSTNWLTHHRCNPPVQASKAKNHSEPSRSKDFFNTRGYTRS